MRILWSILWGAAGLLLLGAGLVLFLMDMGGGGLLVCGALLLFSAIVSFVREMSIRISVRRARKKRLASRSSSGSGHALSETHPDLAGGGIPAAAGRHDAAPS
jgi:hypothetical protein